MRKLAAVLLAFGLILTPFVSAEARVVVVGGYYEGGWGYPYPYYSPYYVAPPPVVYAPQTVYASPPVMAPVTYAPPPVIVSTVPPATVVDQSTIAANQTSPTFIDAQGRTCRHFQSTSAGPAYGTACLMSDGSWRTVN